MSAEDLEKYREELSEDKNHRLDMLRVGTAQKLKAATKKPPEGILGKAGLIVNVVFLLMGINTAFTHIYTSFRYFQTLPLLSIIILGKEFVGFFLCIVPTIKILTKKPENYIFNQFLDPFQGIPFIPKKLKDLPADLKSTLRSFAYAFGCVSNLRMVLSLAIAIRYDISLPLDNHEFDIEKVGNLIVTVLNLVIAIRKDDFIKFNAFISFLAGLFFIVFGFVNHSVQQQALYDFFADLNDGKLCKEDVELFLETLYANVTGEKLQTSFVIDEIPSYYAEESVKQRRKENREKEAEERREKEKKKEEEKEKLKEEKESDKLKTD